MKAIYYPTDSSPYHETVYPEYGDDFDRHGYADDYGVYTYEQYLADKLVGTLIIEALKYRKPKRTDDDIKTPFVWRTHGGEEYLPEEMATSHLFYSIRMMFNNVVPAAYRVGDFKSYPDIRYWSIRYLYTAIYALTQELLDRGDLDEDLDDQFEEIQWNSAALALQEYWWKLLRV